MGGPKSWKGDKKRMKRPQSTEQKKSHEQNVGRLQRVVMKRPHPSELMPPSSPSAAPGHESTAIKKKKRAAAAAPLQGSEKRLRTLNKLLRDIEELQRKDDAGEPLDDAQRAKLERMDDVLEEMEELMTGGGS